MKTPDGTTDLVVAFDLPFPLYIQDSVKEGQFEPMRPGIFIAGDVPAEVHLRRKMVLVPNGIATPLEMEGGDRFGRYAVSELQVRMNLETSPHLRDADHASIVSHAMRAINRLIAHYRDIRDQPMVESVEAVDIGHFNILYVALGKVIHRLAYSTARGPAVGRSTDELEIFDSAIRKRLAADRGPTIYRDLELRANKLFFEFDYRGAIIEGAVLIEAWMKAYVIEQFLAGGKTDSMIKKLMHKKNGEPASADYVARTLVHDATGSPFQLSSQFKDWRKKVADLRNDLIHGTRHDATMTEAKAALDAVHAMVMELRRIAPKGTRL